MSHQQVVRQLGAVLVGLTVPDEDHGGTVLASLGYSTPFLRTVRAPH